VERAGAVVVTNAVTNAAEVGGEKSSSTEAAGVDIPTVEAVVAETRV
jgi:hypothetical protein